MPPEHSSPSRIHEELFDEFLLALEDGTTSDFEAFVAEHPDHEAGLRAIHDRWRRLDDQLDGVLPGPVGDESFFHGVTASNPIGDQLVAASRLELRAGQTLGDYRLIRILGNGGMGQVWEAEQLSLQRRVALKLMRPGRESEGLARALEKEARAGGRAAHPSIVAIHAAGEIDGVHYIAQELVGDGFTLADFLGRLRDEPRLPPETYRRVARLFAEVADAVHAAHEAGVLHRDLKPQNILIGADDRPKVSDFGLAYMSDGSDRRAQPGLIGTYPYMSPEQAGDRDVHIDRRSDVFSLGAVLYEALTLRRAFEGDSGPRILQRILTEDPPEPRSIRSQVPRDLAVITTKALQKLRSDRYQTMAELAADLRRFLSSEPVLAKPETLLSRGTKWSRRHPGKSTAIGLGGVALIVILALLLREVDLRHAAEESAQLAAQESSRATQQAYLADVRAAALLLESADHAEARRQLNAAAVERRGWEWRHYALRADTSLLRLGPNPGGVTAVACAPDGGMVCTGCADGTVRLWDGRTGVERAALPTDHGAVRALAVSGSDAVVVGSEDGSVLVLQDGVFTELWRHEGEVTALAVSNDGRRIASGSTDGRARVWVAGEPELELVVRPGGGVGVLSLALDGRGELLVTCSRYGMVEAWDGLTGNGFGALGLHRDDVTVAASNDGRRIFTGSSDGTLRAFDSVTFTQLSETRAHGFRISSLSVDATGRRIVTASDEDNTVRLWDGERQTPMATLTGHDGRIADLAMSQDGLLIVAGGSDPSAVVWDGRTLGAVVALPAPSRLVTSLAMSADGRRFVTASLLEGVMRLWDGSQGRVHSVLRGHDVGVTAVAMSADGQRLVSGGYEGTIRVWNGQGEVENVFPVDGSGIAALALDAAGTCIITGSHDRKLRFLDAATGEVQLTLVGHTGAVTSVACSDDGRHVVSASDDGMVRLWRDAEPDGLVVRVGDGFDDGLVAMSADGQRFAWASLGDERIEVWDASGATVAVLTGYRNGVTALAMSADGKRIVSASARDDTLRVWDASSGDMLAVLSGHGGSVTAVALSRDGQRILSAARDGTLRVWESGRDSARQLWKALAERR